MLIVRGVKVLSIFAIGCITAKASVFRSVDDPFQILSHRQSNLKVLPNQIKFPSPNTTGGSWQDGFKHAKFLLSQMTLEEKVNVTTGFEGPCVGQTGAVPRLGIKSLCLEDGPLAVRPARRISQFPAQLTVAATWSRNLTSLRAKYLSDEFRIMGVNIWLGPVSSGPLGRSPFGGRNWEGFSPDQYLNGELTALTISNAQENGLMTCVKHFIAYEQETFRNPYNSSDSKANFAPLEQDPISSNLDDRTMHEVYLWSFANAVRVGAATIMCSYNEINQTHACSNDASLNKLLKEELNFAGAVISDWGGTWANTDWNGGMDITMPGPIAFNQAYGSFGAKYLFEAVKNGTVSELRIDDAVLRLLTPRYQFQGKDDQWPSIGFNASEMTATSRSARKELHSRLIADIAEESFTLVKNVRNGKSDKRGLPFDKHTLFSLAVIGQDAGPKPTGWSQGCDGFGSCTGVSNYGILTSGGGSGWGYPPYIIDPLCAIQWYARSGQFDVYVDITGNATTSALQAATAQATVIFVSAYASEGSDRNTLNLSQQDEDLITSVASQNNNTVVILHSSGPVMMPWANNTNITAIAYAYYPGQESGTPIPGLLFGKINPSGKLPFVVASNESDYLPNSIVKDPIQSPQSNFSDGLFVDYKLLQRRNTTPLYPFGHGLSYTSFLYQKLVLKESFECDKESINPTKEKWDARIGRKTKSLYDILLTAYIDVKNIGKHGGKEVAQIYIEFPSSTNEPYRALRGFNKFYLQPGETKRVAFNLTRKDVSYWSITHQHWTIADGKYHFHAGASSIDIRSSASWEFVKN